MSETANDSPLSSAPPEPQSDESTGQAQDQIVAPGMPFTANRILPSLTTPKTATLGRGRRNYTIATDQGGHYVRPVKPVGPARDIALAATLRVAALRSYFDNQTEDELGHISAPSIPQRGKQMASTGSFEIPPSGRLGGATLEQPSISLTPSDLRVKLRRSRTGNLILFAVDASGSMGARKRMVAVKGAILSLLLDAYQKRDRVGLVVFRGQGAELVVPPTNSVELAARHLQTLPTGGRTPLAAGLQVAAKTLNHYLQRDSALTPLLVLITDGRANQGAPTHLRHLATTLAQKRIASLVLDSEQGFVRLGAAQELAQWLGAEYLPLDQMRGEAIAGQVRARLGKILET